MDQSLDVRSPSAPCEPRDGSITICLANARAGGEHAQTFLWNRYVHKLSTLASRQLGKTGSRLVCADDVVSMAFHDFLRGLETDRFQEVGNREDLWQILVMLVRRRSIDQRRRLQSQRRGGGTVSNMGCDVEPLLAQSCLEQTIASEQPTPDETLALREEFECRMNELQDERLQHIAICKLSGFTNREIAEDLACSERSIERKLAIIRRRWSSMLKVATN